RSITPKRNAEYETKYVSTPTTLASLTQLTTLALDWDMTDRPCRLLSSLPCVLHLRLRGYDMKLVLEANPSTFFDRLQTLDIRDVTVSEFRLHSFAALTSLSYRCSQQIDDFLLRHVLTHLPVLTRLRVEE